MKDSLKDITYRITHARSWQWVNFALALFVTSVLCLGFKAVSADHSIRCYYLSALEIREGVYYRIYGDVDWGKSVLAFSSKDPDKTLEVFSTLKQCAGEEK